MPEPSQRPHENITQPHGMLTITNFDHRGFGVHAGPDTVYPSLIRGRAQETPRARCRTSPNG